MTRTKRCVRHTLMNMQCKSCYKGTEFFKIIYMNFMIHRINYYMSSPFGASTAVPIFPVIISVCQRHSICVSQEDCLSLHPHYFLSIWSLCFRFLLRTAISISFVPLFMSQCQFEQAFEVSLRTFPLFVLPGRSVYPVNKLHKYHYTCKGKVKISLLQAMETHRVTRG
jgi:hypothetical protein